MTKALQIKDLKKTYKNGFTALKGVSLDVAKWDFSALFGPNGPGKSTIMVIITSLVIKTEGTVSIFGSDNDGDFALARPLLSLSPQEFNLIIFKPLI